MAGCWTSQNKMKKRGVSPVIATVLIVMLTIAAIAIISAVVVPFVRDSLYKSSECLAYKGLWTFDKSQGYNCYYPVDANMMFYAFSIKSSPNEELLNNGAGFKVVLISNKGETLPLDINNSSPSSTGVGGIWIAGRPNEPIKVPGAGGIITYGYKTDKGQFDAAEVYGVLKSGRICGDEVDRVTLEICTNSELMRTS